MARATLLITFVGAVALGALPAATGVAQTGGSLTLTPTVLPGQVGGQRIIDVQASGYASRDASLYVSWDRRPGPCPESSNDLPNEGGWAIEGPSVGTGPFAQRGRFVTPPGYVRLCGYLEWSDDFNDLRNDAVASVQLVAPRAPAPPNLAARKPEPGWRKAARRLKMPVYRLTYTPGLTLKRVRWQRQRACGVEQVLATYNGPGGDLMRFYQGKPYFCGDLGDVRRLGTAFVRGRKAYFYESPNSDNQGGMFLVWYTAPRNLRARGPGNEMLLEVRGRDKARALRIARSFRLVR